MIQEGVQNGFILYGNIHSRQMGDISGITRSKLAKDDRLNILDKAFMFNISKNQTKISGKISRML